MKQSPEQNTLKQQLVELAPLGYTISFRMLGSAEAAEEALQNAYVEALKGLRGFRGEAALSTWFTRIVINVCNRQFRYLRKLDRLLTGTDMELVPDNSIDTSRDASMTARIHSAVADLPPRQKTALVLRYGEGLDLAQMANVMGCTVGAVKAHLSKGIHKLKKKLTPLPTGEVLHET
ncbi:sigma-70 family RNA polymerase sigma factor [Myxococcota bacterium]|nr:sigma-70 family RNA polymerase sigma factor [Myxococcota bacterium]MBU1537514.1 sigma-70 family RNA polymerase sigma factor [Myxococcota bacterium]